MALFPIQVVSHKKTNTLDEAITTIVESNERRKHLIFSCGINIVKSETAMVVKYLIETLV